MKLAELVEHLCVRVIVAVCHDCHIGNHGVCCFVNLERAYVKAAASEKLGNAHENAEAVNNGKVKLNSSLTLRAIFCRWI